MTITLVLFINFVIDQLHANCGYVTAGCCGCLYKCIASNGKSVMSCILTYAVVKVYGICSFCEHNVKTMQFHTSWCLLEMNRTFFESVTVKSVLR